MARLLAVVLATLLWGACASGGAGETRAPVAEPAPPPEAPLPTIDDFIALVDGAAPGELARTIEVRGYKTQITEIEKRLEVQLSVFNRLRNQPIEFEIRTLFFRADGSIIDATPWARATAPARTTYHYRALAHTDFAEREQVQVRLLRPLPGGEG